METPFPVLDQIVKCPAFEFDVLGTEDRGRRRDRRVGVQQVTVCEIPSTNERFSSLHASSEREEKDLPKLRGITYGGTVIAQNLQTTSHYVCLDIGQTGSVVAQSHKAKAVWAVICSR